jgi:hypothetical protein
MYRCMEEHNPNAVGFENWAEPLLADDSIPNWHARRLAVAAQHKFDTVYPVTGPVGGAL